MVDLNHYFREAVESTFKEKDIPSLDGLRAISVFLVIGGHLYLTQTSHHAGWFIYQDLGVSLFFVISGFLITQILANEYQQTGKVSFKRFFFKRLFRIFPAYYFFLFLTYSFAIREGLNVDTSMFLSCLAYMGSYYPHQVLNIWGHTWSLAVEEQFYLLWPFAFKLNFTIEHFKRIPLILILLAPILRILTYFFIPLYKHKYSFLLHTRMDSLMFGCLYALSLNDPFWLKFKRVSLKKNTFYFSLIYLLVFYPVLHLFYLGKYRATVGYSIEGILLLAIVIHVINTRGTLTYKILNSKTMVHIGSISYGIYLWQQPFTYLKFDNALFSFPLNLMMVYFFAMLSFFFVEYPAMRLRRRFLGQHN